MAVLRVQYASAYSTTAILNAPLATAPVVGHQLVAVQSTSGYNGSFATPAGWAILAGPTLKANSNSIAFWKPADGTEGTSLAFTGHDNDGLSVYEISGQAAGAPIAAFTSDAAANTLITFAAQSPTLAGSLALEFAAPTYGTDTATVPTGYTAETYIAPVGSAANYHEIHAWYLANPGVGADCTRSSTLNLADDWDALIVLIAPLVVIATGTAVGNAAYTSGAIGTGRSATCIGSG